MKISNIKKPLIIRDYQGLTEFVRRRWDSNPRYPFGVYTLSRRAPSTTRTPLLYWKKLGWSKTKGHENTKNIDALLLERSKSLKKNLHLKEWGTNFVRGQEPRWRSAVAGAKFFRHRQIKNFATWGEAYLGLLIFCLLFHQGKSKSLLLWKEDTTFLPYSTRRFLRMHFQDPAPTPFHSKFSHWHTPSSLQNNSLYRNTLPPSLFCF